MNMIEISDNVLILAMIVGGLLLVAIALLCALLVVCLRRKNRALHIGSRYKVRRSDVSNVNYINEQTVIVGTDKATEATGGTINGLGCFYSSSNNSKTSSSFYPFSSSSSRHESTVKQQRPISATFLSGNFDHANEVIDARQTKPRVARRSDISVTLPKEQELISTVNTMMRPEAAEIDDTLATLIRTNKSQINRNSVYSSRNSYYSLYASEQSTIV